MTQQTPEKSSVQLSVTTFTTKETYCEGNGVSVTVTQWSNLAGVNLFIHGEGKHLPLVMAGSLRWEEVDILIAALAAARAG